MVGRIGAEVSRMPEDAILGKIQVSEEIECIYGVVECGMRPMLCGMLC